MGNVLSGKKIAIGGTRKIEEFQTLIEKQGGMAISRPLQGTAFFDEQHIGDDIIHFINAPFDWSVFTTGIGIQAMLDSAEKLNLYEQFVEKIKQTKVACRGYKSFGVLKKLDISPVATDDDGTNAGLIRQLEGIDFQGKNIMVQLHGESAPKLIQFFENQGGFVTQILPYKHIPPEEETVEKLCKEILNDEVDAVCFTTMIQVHNLFAHAKKRGYDAQLIEKFAQNVVAVSVGKVTTEALKDEKVERIVAPEIERMGAMVIELTKYYENQ